MSAVDSEKTASALEVQIVDGNELDTAAHAQLQQRVFGSILQENDIPLERLSAAVFAWKLAPPAGDARIALIEHEGTLLSSCTAFPIELGAGEQRVRGWHVCDAVTAPEARGQRLFSRVLKSLREDMRPNDWLFAFPNGQSKGAFEREGFYPVEEVPLWFRPVRGRGGAIAEAVVPLTRFNSEHDKFAERMIAQGKIGAVRSAAYLTWRYLQHPFFGYQCFELRRGEGIAGLLIVNRMEARGRVSMWVMELLALDQRGTRELARTARELAMAQGCDVVLAMANTRLPGAVRMPPCFLPKKHILMVRSGGAAESKPPSSWDVSTGDWDTF